MMEIQIEIFNGTVAVPGIQVEGFLKRVEKPGEKVEIPELSTEILRDQDEAFDRCVKVSEESAEVFE